MEQIKDLFIQKKNLINKYSNVDEDEDSDDSIDDEDQ